MGLGIDFPRFPIGDVGAEAAMARGSLQRWCNVCRKNPHLRTFSSRYSHVSLSIIYIFNTILNSYALFRNANLNILNSISLSCTK